MIADVRIANKSFGSNELYKDLSIRIEKGEKIGLIGRNGTGKSTLFNIMTGLDPDYDGEIDLGKNIVMVSSRQEHHGYEDMTVLEYILADLPEYAELHHILETYPETMGESKQKLQKYSDALERFNDLGYYEIENDVNRELADYQLSIDVSNVTLGSLSGGQKRMVELVKVQRSRADLALIDEPTNHMDYIAKDSFINWLKSADEAVVVITHDRDVLGEVDRIIEIRDGRALSFPGNYAKYLAQNMLSSSSQVVEYENNLRRIANLKIQIKNARVHKLQAPPDQAKKWRILENRIQRQHDALIAQNEKPSLWIDRESVSNLGTKLSESYEQHKTRNIRVRTKITADKSERVILKVDSLGLGYTDKSLFAPVSFEQRLGAKVELKGRNGAGKTTIVRTILDTVSGKKPSATIFSGTIEHEKGVRIGVYEQEISSEYLDAKLGDAIEKLYVSMGLPITDEKIKQLLSDYLFNPHTDAVMPLSKLSGGQKARFQLISMLAGDPQMLILDEPTNHLDLPSIEELEDALAQYHGSILYISHDSYFTKSLGGTVVEVAQC